MVEESSGEGSEERKREEEDSKGVVVIRLCVSVLLAGLILAGCASKSVRYADRTVTADMLQDQVAENQLRVRSLTGTGTISVETSEMAQSGSFDLILRKPDSVLVKIEGPFGIDVGSALVTRTRFAFYYSFQNRLVEGPTNAANLSRVFQIPIDFDDVMNLFTGGFFLSEDRTSPSDFAIVDEEFVMTYSSYTGTRRYWIDSETLQIVKIQHLDGKGTLLLEQLFSKFRTMDGVTIPQYVRVTMVKERRRVSIAYSDLTINPGHVDFFFDVPRNASRGRLQ